MEKRVCIFIATALLLILLSLLPLIEMFELISSEKKAETDHILTELKIDPQNIDEMISSKNINLSDITIKHEFVDEDDKSTLVHHQKDFKKLLNKSTYYIRTYEFKSQSIALKENLKKKLVEGVIENDKLVHLKDITTSSSLDPHYKGIKLLYEKDRLTGEKRLIFLKQHEENIEYLIVNNQSKNEIGKTTLEKINHDGQWLNRLKMVDFEVLKTQKPMHYLFMGFIFYPLMTMLLGAFLLYICYLRLKTTGYFKDLNLKHSLKQKDIKQLISGYKNDD